ncbi:MAG: glycosyltransferase family 4 protein [Patescibacteria group bacterium]
MLKIAYIGQKGILNPSGGGVETHVEELSLRMAKKGHTVFLYTRPYYTPKEYKKYEDVFLVSLPSLHTKHLDALIHSLFAILHAIKNKVDIIHIHGVGPSFWSFLPRILAPKIKVISTAHSQDWEHQKWNWFARTSLKFGAWVSAKTAHEVITVSKELQKRFLKLYKRSITLIPNGVLIKKNVKANQSLIKKFGLQKNKYIIVVSRLVRHKGIHYLIEAFKQIKNNSKLKDFKLVIVGPTAFTDDYFDFLKSMVNGRNDIIFTGAQKGETLENLFINSYLYVSPSMSEGLSIALLEAMGYGKAVLVSDIPANMEATNGDTNLGSVGFTFKNRNIGDLANKLEILVNSPEIVRMIGKKAQKYVGVYYNWDEIADRTDKIYMSIVLAKDKARQPLYKQFTFALKKA